MVGVVAAGAVFVGGAVAASTVVVHPGDMQGWAFAQETPNGSGAMVNGPGSPPLGSGSANLIVDSTGGEILATANHNGTRLDAIDTLTYSTYRAAGGDALAIALQFDIDLDATDANTAFQGRLVYEPYYTHDVQANVWQTWNTQDDAAGGNWWFTRAPGNLTCSIANPCTWSEVLAAYPNAAIRQGTFLKAGGGWLGGFNGNVDALTIGDTTYDFELAAPSPTSKEQCKNGGWQTFTNPSFANQGDCVSFVVSQQG